MKLQTNHFHGLKKEQILVLTNKQVGKVDNQSGTLQTQIYYAVHTVMDIQKSVNYPTEFLKSLCSFNIRPQKLAFKLKWGSYYIVT